MVSALKLTRHDMLFGDVTSGYLGCWLKHAQKTTTPSLESCLSRARLRPCMHAWVVGSLEQRRGKWAKHGIFGSLALFVSTSSSSCTEDYHTIGSKGADHTGRLPKISCFAHFPLRCSSDPTHNQLY